jgi:hypothetical protein
MLRPITKLLITLTALVPASLLIFHFEREAVIQQAKMEGYFTAWVEPGFIIKAMMVVGCIAFLFAVVSTISDVRRSRS